MDTLHLAGSQPPIPTFADRGRVKRTVPCIPNVVNVF